MNGLNPHFSEGEHCAIESLPPWERYLLYVDRAKEKNEVVMSYDQWAEANAIVGGPKTEGEQ